jgi:hypothetical protein
MCGRFESRFKQCDESSVNDFNSRVPGKLPLSTQVPNSWGFLLIGHVPLTVAILSPLTIAPGRPQAARTDTENEDVAQRSRPLIGVQVVIGMRPPSADRWGRPAP